MVTFLLNSCSVIRSPGIHSACLCGVMKEFSFFFNMHDGSVHYLCEKHKCSGVSAQIAWTNKNKKNDKNKKHFNTIDAGWIHCILCCLIVVS